MASATMERTNGTATLEYRQEPAARVRTGSEKAESKAPLSARLMRELDEYYDCLAAMEEEAGVARRG